MCGCFTSFNISISRFSTSILVTFDFLMDYIDIMYYKHGVDKRRCSENGSRTYNKHPQHAQITNLHGITCPSFTMVTFPYHSVVPMPQFFHINVIIQSNITQGIRDHHGRSTPIMTTDRGAIRVGAKCMSRLVHFQFMVHFVVFIITIIIMIVRCGFGRYGCCVDWIHNRHFLPGGSHRVFGRIVRSESHKYEAKKSKVYMSTFENWVGYQTIVGHWSTRYRTYFLI